MVLICAERQLVPRLSDTVPILAVSNSNAVSSELSLGGNALSSGVQVFKDIPIKSALGITSTLSVFSVCSQGYQYWVQYKQGIITKEEFWEKLAYSATTEASGVAGAMAGAAIGAVAGAAVGSLIPVLGTTIGGRVGMALGSEMVKEKFKSETRSFLNRIKRRFNPCGR